MKPDPDISILGHDKIDSDFDIRDIFYSKIEFDSDILVLWHDRIGSDSIIRDI